MTDIHLQIPYRLGKFSATADVLFKNSTSSEHTGSFWPHDFSYAALLWEFLSEI